MSRADLQGLQATFQNHLLTGDAGVSETIRGGGIGVERRLAIYHRAYRQRLLETLRDTFGHTLLYLGDELFDLVALAHVEQHPSTHPSLRDYGEGFEHTLAAQLPQAPEAAELAVLDRTLRHAFDSADATPLTLADLAAIAPQRWATLGFVLHPSTARLCLQHNTLSLWQALDQDEDPPPALPLAEPGELLVWRRGHQPHFRSLAPLEAVALDALLAGASFADAGARLAERWPHDDTAAQLGTLLRRWVDEALLSAVR